MKSGLGNPEVDAALACGAAAAVSAASVIASSSAIEELRIILFPL
jgi:hypothetical protein